MFYALFFRFAQKACEKKIRSVLKKSFQHAFRAKRETVRKKSKIILVNFLVRILRGPTQRLHGFFPHRLRQNLLVICFILRQNGVNIKTFGLC